MIGKAACRGAATIVNAIATGKGAAFGISLEVDAAVELTEGPGEITLRDSREGADLVAGCVRAIAKKALGNRMVNGEVHVKSEIPVSRGLKSSSAVSNAVALATAKAVGTDLPDMEIILAGIEESIKAGVTITGAFDDASACYFGGVVVTDNRNFAILHRGTLDPDLEVLLHVPDRKITKASVKGLDFSPIRKEVEKAYELAMQGSYLKAMEVNSRAYAKVLDVSEDVAELARKKGALAAGISGTGPATAIICDKADVGVLMSALQNHDGAVLRAHINDVPAREVVPRLL
ncbi:MAG: shikimate kinase [Euryarchaeota archaeon RBG_13_57_23]|nr:MAG: shikimate kinase [Euryarchaeota archaeon RBG_13_57_23]